MILGKMELLLKPLAVQLTAIEKSVQQEKDAADTALDSGFSLQKENCTLQQKVTSLKEKLLILDTSVCQSHLKFRGMTEGLEDPAFVGSWNAEMFQLEGGISLITKPTELGNQTTHRESSQEIF